MYRPWTSYPARFNSNAETAESTPPDMPTTILSELEGTARIVRRARGAGGRLHVRLHVRLQADGGVHAQGVVESQRGHGIQRLAGAQSIVIDAAEHERGPEAVGLREQLIVCHPHAADDADVERKPGLVVVDRAAECEAQETAFGDRAAPEVHA